MAFRTSDDALVSLATLKQAFRTDGSPVLAVARLERPARASRLSGIV